MERGNVISRIEFCPDGIPSGLHNLGITKQSQNLMNLSYLLHRLIQTKGSKDALILKRLYYHKTLN